MIPRLLRIREDQDKQLKALPGKYVDHVRNAIDDYLKKQIKVSSSASQKGGQNNG